jgi:polysaccharide deacetylase family protein (PEP-CTERM system associated)
MENTSPGPPTDPHASTPGSRHLLSVVLEDYFQVAPLRSVIQTGQWYRFETRVESNTTKALDLLDEFGIKATFFVLGWIADEMPEVVRRVAARGHEIASKGYYHRSIRQLSREEFRDDLLRSRAALEGAAGRPVHGYRIAHGWFTPQDLWALEVLAEEGFLYDSSIRPIFRAFARHPERRRVHQERCGERTLWEFPISSWTLGGWSIPIAGGNYLRQFPPALMRRAVAHWHRTMSVPFLMYFHVWELDPDQPRVHAAPWFERVRQYRNLERMDGIIRGYLGTYRFGGIADYLAGRGVELPARPAAEAVEGTAAECLHLAAGGGGQGEGGGREDAFREAREAPGVPESPGAPKVPGTAQAPQAPQDTGEGSRRPFRPWSRPFPLAARRQPISVVIPCYNEEFTLPYLGNTLKSLSATLEADYDVRYAFVDDGSADGTWAALERLFGGRPDCVLVRHAENRGVAAAILTGLRHVSTEVVCSMDCDCTYDPHQLRSMIPMLKDGVDMVTASPYHPHGRVRNVPGWRLGLSKSLSLGYRLVLRQKLATYTSCFRVYRRSAVVGLPVRAGGFLGVAEMLALLDLAGGHIVECPAVLEVRLLGRSKMKVLNAIAGHLRLLARLAVARFVQQGGATPAEEPAETVMPTGKTSALK